MASNKYKKRRIGFVILLLLLLLIAVGVITVTGEINGGKKTGETVTVSIAQGSGTSAIAQELKDAGLIGNTTLFKLYSRTHGGDGRYQYGDFTLEKGSSYQELIDALCSTVSYRETVTLTLPEGWNSFQMAKAAAAAGICTEEEYLAAANATDYDFDWLSEVSTDGCKLTVLEGFLYPETYSFYTDATARDIVTTQLREFEKKVLTEESHFKKILAINIPKQRTFMHLDTVFTMVDYDKFTIHPNIMRDMDVFVIERDKERRIKITQETSSLEDILKRHLNLDKVTLIKCGSNSVIDSAREQWNDGSNTLAIAPGEVIVYSRNYVTNEILQENGVKTYVMPSSELSRGRGGPRCMSMPLIREDL